MRKEPRASRERVSLSLERSSAGISLAALGDPREAVLVRTEGSRTPLSTVGQPGRILGLVPYRRWAEV